MSESRTGSERPKPIELRRSAGYEAARAHLTPSRRKWLDEAENEIAEDPQHTHWRRDTTDGAVLEYFAAGAGLIVKFRVVSPTLVDLEAVIDIEHLTSGRR